MLTSEIRVDVNNHTAPDIYARVGESNTRRVKFSPGYYDADGNFVGLSTEEESIRVQFRMVKPDNTFVVVDLPISIVEDPITFRVMLTPEMCQVAGSGYYDIRIGDSEDSDEFLYTASGRFVIDDNMLSDEMIESVAAVNGLIFPDDFLTSADLSDYATKEYVDDAIAEIDLSNYATKEYVDDAIAAIPDPLHTYSDTEEQIIGTWIDGSTLYEKTFTWTLPNSNAYTSKVINLPASTNNAWIDSSASYAAGSYGTAIFRSMWTAYASTVAETDAKGFFSCNNGTWAFEYRVGSYMYNGTGILTIRYTKS